MKFFLSIFFVVAVGLCFGQSTDKTKVQVQAIHHASMLITYNDLNIFIDPSGDWKDYEPLAKPDLILITHTHGDHFNPELVGKLRSEKTSIIGSKAAINQLGYGIVMENGETLTSKGIKIEAIAAYNTTEERKQNHERGVGNGYVLTLGNERVYISGDTEDIREMRNLKNIDHAFVCMNLPFTMTPEQAASAVLDFKPKKVYPYHYSQKNGFSDIEKFKSMVAQDKNIELIFLKWYN